MAHNLGFLDYNSDDIHLLFRRFDKSGNGLLQAYDFNRLLLPFSREYASLITDRLEYYGRRPGHNSTYFNPDTRYEMQAFFGVLMRAER